MLEAPSPSEVGRTAPESAGVRRAWVKPEAHSYINVKACPIDPVLAVVENPKRQGPKLTYKYNTLQPVGFPISHNVAHYVNCGGVNDSLGSSCGGTYQRYTKPTYTPTQSVQRAITTSRRTHDRLKRVKKERKGFVEYPTQDHHEPK